MTGPGSLSFVGIIDSVGGGANPPVIALAEGLRSRGHHVALIADEVSAPQAAHRGFEVITIPPDLALSTFFRPLRSPRVGESLDELANPFALFGKAAVGDALSEVQRLSPTLVFCSIFTLGLADELSRALDVPWCLVNPAFVDTEGRMRPLTEDFLDLVPRKVRADWLPPLSARADLVIHATDREYDRVTDEFPQHHHQVGPLNLTSSVAAPDFIAEPGPPWALISTSTVPVPTEESLIRVALTALSDQPLRVIATAASLVGRFCGVPLFGLTTPDGLMAPHSGRPGLGPRDFQLQHQCQAVRCLAGRSLCCAASRPDQREQFPLARGRASGWSPGVSCIPAVVHGMDD